MKEMPSIICGDQAYQFLEYPGEKRGKRTWSGKARNASDGRLYFIKYARQGDENALFLLRREAKFRISHRSIMKVYGGYQGTLRMGMRGEEVSFVLSEWIDGYSLPEYLERPQIKRLRKEAPEEFNEKADVRDGSLYGDGRAGAVRASGPKADEPVSKAGR